MKNSFNIAGIAFQPVLKAIKRNGKINVSARKILPLVLKSEVIDDDDIITAHLIKAPDQGATNESSAARNKYHLFALPEFQKMSLALFAATRDIRYISHQEIDLEPGLIIREGACFSMYHLGQDAPIVQKYGGTSVGTLERIDAVAKRVADQHREGYRKIAIVVSAMSGETNRLVDMMNGINPLASLRNYDMAVAAGEQVCVALMAAALEKHGIPSRGFLGYQLGIMTDTLHSKARIEKIETHRLHECWGRGEIPVVAGFQGMTGDREITTLGRGGSDTSAVALAVALEASFCEINTDVDGVFTADPRIVPDARLETEMDFEVALEMASLGSKVLHSRCVELGAKYSMPIVVRNTFKPNDHPRTLIMNFSPERKLEAPVVSGVTLDKKVVRVSMHNLPVRSGIIGSAFEVIASSGVNVDIIVHNRSQDSDTMRVGFTIGEADLVRTKDLLEKWTLERKLGAYIEVESGLSKISVVGLGMQSHPGVASRVFSCLEDAGIALHMISTSEIKISVVISEKEGDSAARALHKEFVLPAE